LKEFPERIKEKLGEFSSCDLCKMIEDLLDYEENGLGNFTITELITALITEMNNARRPVPINSNKK
jgi:hypothetical protein